MKKRSVCLILAISSMLSISDMYGQQTVAHGEIAIPDAAKSYSLFTSPWNGNQSVSLPGSGTQEDPYVVCAAVQLAYIAHKVNNGESYRGKYFLLAIDIDLSNQKSATPSENNWQPIGNSKETPFAGRFYGNGHTIRNLSIVKLENKKQVALGGLFGYIDKEGCVKGVKLDNSCTIQAETAGGVAAVNQGTIEACESDAKIEGTTVGGIAGINQALIRGCLATGHLEPISYGGGIAARSSGLVEACGFRGKMKFFSLSNYCGGIVGELLKEGKIRDCYNRGNISADLVAVTPSVGGITGTKKLEGLGSAEISNSYSAGKVKGNHLLPQYRNNISQVTNCYFDTDVKSFTKAEKKESDFYMENGGRSSSQMKSEELIAALNGNRPQGRWIADTQGVNSGYPILNGVDNGMPDFIMKPDPYLITAQGIGYVKLTDKEPNLSNEFNIDFVEDMHMGNHYHILHPEKGVIMGFNPNRFMIAYSGDFYTAEGLHVGMTLQEALEILKDHQLEVGYEYPLVPLFQIKYADKLMIEISQEGLKGGKEAYDNWLQHWYTNKALRPKIEDFNPEAKIVSIRVLNE